MVTAQFERYLILMEGILGMEVLGLARGIGGIEEELTLDGDSSSLDKRENEL